MSQFVQIQAAGLSEDHPMITKIELVLYLTFRPAPVRNKKTGVFSGDSTLDIRFQGPPTVYEVKFKVLGRMTRRAHSFFPDCVTYNAAPMHDRLVGLTRKELTAIGEKLSTVIKLEIGCNCKPISADKFAPNVSERW